MTAGRQRVVVDLTSTSSPVAQTVVSAAVQLFTVADPVDVVLALSDEPTAAEAEAVLAWCLQAVSKPEQLPEVLLVGAAEVGPEPVLVRVTADGDAAGASRAIALLTAAAESLWSGDGDDATSPSGAGGVDRTAAPAALERARALTRVARRDVRSALAIAAGERRPTVVGLFQHISYWAAVESVYRELAARPEVDFVPVALDRGVDARWGRTSEFLVEQGLAPRSTQWLLEHLDEVDAVVLENPYDEMRPPSLRVEAFARAGVRLVGLPYGNNAIGGAFMDALLWDLPLQRLAWRYYLPSPDQRAEYARLCAAGDEPVRVLGSPKHDWLVGEPDPPTADGLGARLHGLAAGRPIVMWNPHFRTGPGGWSTAIRYARQLVDHARQHDDLVLVVRPHFRLFRELQAGGLGRIEQDLRAAAAELPHVVLDETPDYREAFGVADAMVSDLSSLATEFMVTGRPLLYLRRADGPGENDHGAFLRSAAVADQWPQVEAFLDDVRAGRDPGRAARLAAVAAAFPFLDGASTRRIVDDLVGGLLAELVPPATGIPARSAGPDEPGVARPSAGQWAAARGRPLTDAVVLTSFGGRGTGCNPRAIADELERVGHRARRWWVVRGPGDPVPPGCEPLLLGSADYVEALARARWVVDNDATPPELRRRDGQTVLQTWHGTPLKLLRFDLHELSPRSEETLAYLGQQAAQWTHVLSPNPFTTQVLRRGFRYGGQVLESGYPRNDVLADLDLRSSRGAHARHVLGVRPDQRVVLYAPTWREDQIAVGPAVAAVTHPTLDWAGVRSALGPDTALWLRAHRFVPSAADALTGPGVQDVSDYPDMADLLAAADVLVTDYSSSFFDFAITGRPMMFFAPDLGQYRDGQRGHYLDLEQVAPGPVLTEPHRVTEALATVSTWREEYADRYQQLVRTYAPWDDGKAAQRVVEELFG